MQKIIKTVMDLTKDPEQLKKITDILEKGDVFLRNNTDKIVSGIDSLSDMVKAHTPVLCEMLSTERVDREALKIIIKNTQIEGSRFVAVLHDGRNHKDKLHLFLQYLDADKNAVDTDKVFCIECDMIAEDIKTAFGDKEMIIINL